MKILDTPRSGKCGQTVAFQSRYGLCLRQHVPQKAGLTPARQHSCAIFGGNSRVAFLALSVNFFHLVSG